MSSTDLTPFGSALKALLNQRGMSQANLARLSGLQPYEVSRIVRDERKPTLQIIEMICKALDASIKDLVVGTTAEEFVAQEDRHVPQREYQRVLDALADAQRKYLESETRRAEAEAARDDFAARAGRAESQVEDLKRQLEEAVGLASSRREALDHVQGQLTESRAQIEKLQATIQGQAAHIRSQELAARFTRAALALAQGQHETLRQAYGDLYEQYATTCRQLQQRPQPANDAGALLLAGLVGFGVGALTVAAIQE